MVHTKRARYTLEFKLEAVRLVGAGQRVSAVAAILGLPDQTLHNWLKAHREGSLAGPSAKPVTPAMTQHGIRAITKRKFRATTNSAHDLPVTPNLIQRDFRQPRRIGSGLLTSRPWTLANAGCI